MENLVFIGFLFIPVILISFIITLISTPQWIRRAKHEKLVGRDIHKKDKREVAEGGGITVAIGFVIAVFMYMGIRTFVFHDEDHLIELFAVLGVLFFAVMVGFMDDLLGWKKGLSKRMRILMVFFAAVPLMVLNAGDTVLFGMNFGVFYALLIIPFAIVATTTTFNFLAGYNGLETSQAIIILTALSIINLARGNLWLALIVMSMVASLVAFYFFNKYPSKVFPGDIMTYMVGAMIGCVAILGRMEKITAFIFIPYILEMILKLRGKLNVESFGAIQKDGSLELRQKGIYGLEHLAIVFLKKIKPSKKAYEWEVPMVINGFQILIIILALFLFL